MQHPTSNRISLILLAAGLAMAAMYICFSPPMAVAQGSYPPVAIYKEPHRILPPISAPGAINPDITQANIKTTICVAGWTATVRPPTSYTDKLKAALMAQFRMPGVAGDEELDHRVDLAEGGAPRDPKNLWLEPWPDAHLKDRLEVLIHKETCSGKMTLAQGRAIFLGDWWAEYNRRYEVK